MIDRRRAFRLFGESVRETGILIFVFMPLDALFEQMPPGALTITLSMFVGLLFVFGGIIIESVD